MSWSSDDGQHEGWAAMVFSDGAIGGGWRGGSVLVSQRADGSLADLDEERPEQEVAGWQTRCSCGWVGTSYKRVVGVAGTDLAAGLVASEDSHIPGPVEDGVVHGEWSAHVEPAEALGRLGGLSAELRSASDRLDNAVAAVRATGVSWAVIGNAVGVSRQTAHERWARKLIVGPLDPPSLEEVTDLFETYVTQRADEGVMIAKAVSDVTFHGGVVRVTFDPALAGVAPAYFHAFKAFDNLAQFIATPVVFNDEIGRRFRPVIDAIETYDTARASLGTCSRSEILAINELAA